MPTEDEHREFDATKIDLRIDVVFYPENSPEKSGENFDASKTDSEITVDFNPERARLDLAKAVLLGIFALTLFVISIYAFSDETSRSKEIFEFFKISIPPIVTLILGAYFRIEK